MSLRITPIDDTLVTEGAPFNYLGVKLFVARANNEKFRRIFRRLSKPHQRQIEAESLSEDISDDIMCKAISQAILVDWDSTTFPNNLAYSVDNAYMLLMDDEDCRSAVMEFARTEQNYYIQEVEEKKLD